jgi:hypothetical protein
MCGLPPLVAETVLAGGSSKILGTGVVALVAVQALVGCGLSDAVSGSFVAVEAGPYMTAGAVLLEKTLVQAPGTPVNK